MNVPSELFPIVVSFLFTLFILSYLVGDNPLFRAASYIFVGVAAGYVAAVAWNQVVYPYLLQPIFSGVVFGNIKLAVLLLFPLLGSALLLTKISPRFSKLGQLPMAFLVGVGSAAAIGGAVVGTLIPQVDATLSGFDVGIAVSRNIRVPVMIFNSGVILVGVVGTLIYFHFGARQKADGSIRRNLVIELLTWIGRIYIAITFGILFAGVYFAALTALIERMDSIRNTIIALGQSF